MMKNILASILDRSLGGHNARECQQLVRARPDVNVPLADLLGACDPDEASSRQVHLGHVGRPGSVDVDRLLDRSTSG